MSLSLKSIKLFFLFFIGFFEKTISVYNNPCRSNRLFNFILFYYLHILFQENKLKIIGSTSNFSNYQRFENLKKTYFIIWIYNFIHLQSYIIYNHHHLRLLSVKFQWCTSTRIWVFSDSAFQAVVLKLFEIWICLAHYVITNFNQI